MFFLVNCHLILLLQNINKKVLTLCFNKTVVALKIQIIAKKNFQISFVNQ